MDDTNGTTVVVVEGGDNPTGVSPEGEVVVEPSGDGTTTTEIDAVVSAATQAETSAITAQIAAEGAVALANVQAALTEAQVAEVIVGLQSWQSQVAETLTTMQANQLAMQTELSELTVRLSTIPSQSEVVEEVVQTINPVAVEEDHPAQEVDQPVPRQRYRLRI